ncbi:ATP-dependent Clp protease proteolytic subunit [Ethanoligenens harbinense]|uniref:ATP-dependent Clp protease proteolytic subunit n=1 Tax=Ethanoligenens harbinense TaxID=253239 RepID=UPI0003113A9E|nr:ATP-dependent Clp protease proteolytic subunit [Ethanoligenens harbinense]AVQ94829.1 hypothetical protein CXQ68_00315 [Ethanoligenens harbinense YUAN-3]AYF37519.1 hypothetical protein CXP51_00315 [Ethanoligenens harbinense]AYF40240.1 hypothetical protein CN246_00315 [Ethanoligenens harbinense]QCN91075.1 hypothetical protein DRA42_00325 [Ethanoligenens harbinense]
MNDCIGRQIRVLHDFSKATAAYFWYHKDTQQTIKADTNRDHYMTAEESRAYGLVDGVIHRR